MCVKQGSVYMSQSQRGDGVSAILTVMQGSSNPNVHTPVVAVVRVAKGQVALKTEASAMQLMPVPVQRILKAAE